MCSEVRFVYNNPVSLNMGLDYSYSQPSQSEEFGGDESDSDYNEIEALIQQDQAQLDYVNAQEFVYPPQPEVEFGFPHTCYCGSQPQIATSHSRTDLVSLYSINM
ncbi:hypothetical protein Bca52824_071642 [Brassica carinata]|uniref:Uncharacterized protein n=1 Tax=Brassica carinata TaxID=52824 RepID=A0A8X7Q7I1_BRACI|nr:hypothetical protein Bca52824_071642 [Brassica carinata]